MPAGAPVLLAILATRLRSCIQNREDYLGLVSLWLQRLADNLTLIQPAVRSATNTGLLDLIKEATYDADDVLDTLEHRLLQREAESTERNSLGVSKICRWLACRRRLGLYNLGFVMADKLRCCTQSRGSLPKGRITKALINLLKIATCGSYSKDTASFFSAELIRLVTEITYDEDDVLYRLNKGRAAAEERRRVGCSLTVSHSHHFLEQDLLRLCKVVIRFGKIARSLKHVESVVDLDEATLPEGRPEMIPVSLGKPELFSHGRGKQATLDRIPVGKSQLELVGRGKEKERILQFLTGPGPYVQVLPIVGVGGVGKTTLAQWAYNNQFIQQQFDVKAWVNASKASELEELMTKIIESASIERPDDFDSHDFQDLGGVAEILSKGLERKKFLIILDDVGKFEIWEWDLLEVALNHGMKGSRVLITTRSKSTARIMSTFDCLHLRGLKDTDTLALFMNCAFGDENPKHHPELEEIAINLASILSGLPLEVKILGGLLNAKFNKLHWRAILQEYSMLLQSKNSKILPSLRISYAYLPEHLKQCFAYCSLFPKGYAFDRERFVQIWMALGFVLPSEQKKTEDIARDYFDELLRRSFFEKKQHQDGYVIHDCILLLLLLPTIIF